MNISPHTNQVQFSQPLDLDNFINQYYQGLPWTRIQELHGMHGSAYHLAYFGGFKTHFLMSKCLWTNGKGCGGTPLQQHSWQKAAVTGPCHACVGKMRSHLQRLFSKGSDCTQCPLSDLSARYRHRTMAVIFQVFWCTFKWGQAPSSRIADGWELFPSEDNST
jgi:hypothetical protein